MTVAAWSSAVASSGSGNVVGGEQVSYLASNTTVPVSEKKTYLTFKNRACSS